jgi:hypothetical protein
MERGNEETSGREPDEERQETEEERGAEKERDEDSPGPRERTEEEEAEQREEDARQARERLEEVRDAPPEEHAALKAGALGSTIILIGALFIVFGVIVALAFSPWGWAGVAIGVGEVIVGQLIRTGALGRMSGD